MSPDGSTRLESAGAVLECSIVPWDTETFGFPVAQIGRVELGQDAEPTELLDAFEAWCAGHDVRLISCRLDHLQLRESMALEERGFRFVEMVYGPRFDSFEAIAAPRRDLQVAEATPADLAGIEDIAYSAFTTGRFLLDARLAPDLSRRRYATWVRTSFESPGHTILKAEADGDLVGFLIVEHRPDQSVYWHLTAIAPEWQGVGMGMSLWQAMLLRHRAEGASFVETTISGHNLPIINLYARLGFSFASAQMTFHRLRAPKP
jgi:ribosomal protein S18 acetylase RimI-like enzyme